ncbi:PREDICTED: zinc finger matrin-type protein 3-like, partial [Ceratosolen solmsi marchali]|uniref:Zinc finger matrin-type protein 3-like n=1 Tax=Ceratosolen solmsi marchali TaxID=326594 RepID=A0AAJ6YC84_9HYME
MFKSILFDKIKNPDVPGFEEILPLPPPKITVNTSEKIKKSCNSISYPNILSYYIPPSIHTQGSANQSWWIPTSLNTSDVYTQWYESAYKAALQAVQEKDSTDKTKLKYFKRKLEVIDAKIDAEKVANAQNELSLLMKSLKCDLCNAIMNSTLQAKLHYQGKPHQKKVSMFLNQSAKKVKHEDGQVSNLNDNDWDIYCEVCKTWFTSPTDASQHYAGKKHLKVAFGLNRTKTSKKVQSQTNISIDSTDQFGIGLTYSEIQLPCLSVLETPSVVISTQNSISEYSQCYLTPLRCDLCGISVNRQDQLDMHTRGTKHIKMLKFHGFPLTNAEAVSIISKPIDYSIYRTPSGQYYCAPCNISLNSEVTFGRHMESKKHRNQISSKSQTPLSP